MTERVYVVEKILEDVLEFQELFHSRAFGAVKIYAISKIRDFADDQLGEKDIVTTFLDIFIDSNYSGNDGDFTEPTAAESLSDLICELRYELRLSKAENKLINRLRKEVF
jgi:hypothetical protein